MDLVALSSLHTRAVQISGFPWFCIVLHSAGCPWNACGGFGLLKEKPGFEFAFTVYFQETVSVLRGAPQEVRLLLCRPSDEELDLITLKVSWLFLIVLLWKYFNCFDQNTTRIWKFKKKIDMLWICIFNVLKKKFTLCLTTSFFLSFFLS